MNCHFCQEPLPADANFCPVCGTLQQQAATGATQRLGAPNPRTNTMRQGRCPQCSATFVYSDENSPAKDKIVINIGYFREAATTYACKTCGYIEFYLLRPETLDELPYHWAHVPCNT